MKKILSLDSTILNTAQACLMKAHYNFQMNVQPKQKALPLEKGSLMHTMLEIYYSIIGRCIHEESDVWKEILAQGFVIPPASKQKAAQFAIECGRMFAAKSEIPIEDGEEVMYQFKAYCEYYEGDSWEPLAVEQVGSKVLYETDDFIVVYNFKVDLIARKGNIIAPFDHKTGNRSQSPSALSNQFMGYAWALEKSNVIVNKIGFQKTLSPAQRFQRYILSYSRENIQEWVNNTIYWCQLLIEHIEANHWPMNLTSCDKYGGCIYMPLCEATPDSREWKIVRDYSVGKSWDVASILEAPK